MEFFQITVQLQCVKFFLIFWREPESHRREAVCMSPVAPSARRSPRGPEESIPSTTLVAPGLRTPGHSCPPTAPRTQGDAPLKKPQRTSLLPLGPRRSSQNHPNRGPGSAPHFPSSLGVLSGVVARASGQCPSRSWSGRWQCAVSTGSWLSLSKVPVTRRALQVTSSLTQGTCKRGLFEKGSRVSLCTQDLWK